MLTNSQGFKRFFELYFEPVYRFVRKYTEEDAIARDITQDTFIRLYERRRDFDVPEKAKSFIYITARNLCLDHLKHQKNKTTIPTDTIGIRGHFIGSERKKQQRNRRSPEHSVNTVKSLKKSAYTSLRGQLKDPMLFLLFLLIDS